MEDEQRTDIFRGAYGVIISVVLVPAVLAYFQMTPTVMILGAICSLVALAAWQNRHFLWSRLGPTLVTFVIAGGLLGFDAWYYSNIRTNGWYWHFTVSFPVAAITPPTQPPPPPVKPPEKPWVTDDEVEQAKKNNRILVRYSPVEMMRMAMYGQSNIAVYQESWIKFSQSFQSVDFVETADKKKLYAVNGTYAGPTLLFDPKQWGPILLTLKEGQHIQGMCQILGFVNSVFYLATCELN